MAKSRRISKKNISVIRPLESLEDRRLMTITSWDLVSTSDSVYTQIPVSGPQTGSYYSIRALVEYYNTVYNGESNQPFTIQLGNGTYTLSETTSTSNLWGGRLDNNNQYGDLDVNPLNTTAPLIIQGVSGGTTVITCSGGQTSSGISFGLDRLIQVESGTLQVQNLTLKYGQALDNGTTNKETSGLGGAVLVNPGGAFSLTNCVVSANSAGAATTNYSYTSGLNAAGGGLYGSPGSTISINGNNTFLGNDAKAGKGGTSGSTGQAGGNAYGAGIAIDAPVPDNITDVNFPITVVNFNGGSGKSAIFQNNRLNSYVAYTGKVINSGGTGGAGTGTGGAGGNAYGAGLYIGSGQLNINGGSTNSPITFTGNQARGGTGASTNTAVAGANGSAYGAGVYYMPGQVTPVVNSPSSGGIMQFSNNTAGGATSGLYIPTVSASVADSQISANSPWNLRTAVAASTALSNTGMSIGLNLGSGDFTLNQGTGLSIQGGEVSSPITIIGAGKSASKIIGGTSTNSIFNIANKNVILSNLTLTGATVSGTNGGAISATNADVTLNSVSVTKNSVSYNSGNGGGIYQNGGSLTLNNSNISNNNVANGSGGGIFSYNGVLESNNSSISYNKATGYWGGGLYANSANVTLANTTMVYNTDVNQTGGAICQSAGSLTIQNSNISYNNATTGGGGGIFVNEGCDLNISGGTISYNSAVGSGGGIQGYGSGLIKIKGTTIKNNSSGICGGGVANTGGSMALTSASISNNSAANGDGGGLFQQGGTLYVSNATKLNYNSANQGGGAFLTTAFENFNGGTVIGNKASVNGGGLMSWNNTLYLTNVSVASNSASSTSGNYGGGLYQNAGGSMNLTGTTVQKNSAMFGGGILCDGSSFVAENSNISKNNAIYEGGGFAAYTNGKTMNFSSVNISSNTLSSGGSSYGAGMYVNGGTLNTNGFNLKNNKITATSNATIQGAGIYATGTSINFNGGTSKTTTISGNKLVGSGGGTAYGAGISAQSGTSVNDQSVITFSNNTITNTANGVGGAIAFFANTSYASSYSITCSGNSANAGGNDYAFELAVNTDNNNSSSQNGPSGISYFTNTSGSASLRNAIEYCQTWMNGNSNNNSMAIMLPSTSNYVLYTEQQISTSVASGDSLTIIGTNGTATIQGYYNRTMYVGGSGTLVLQNVNICGGDVSAGTNAQGGGIYQASGTVTLNNVVMYGNVVTATQTGSDGANGGQGDNGGGGGTGGNAYGGAYFLAGGILNLTSSATIGGTLSTWQNSVTGATGGSGGNGGSGGCEHTGLSGCKNQIDGGAGGNGGNGGVALGGGIYQNGGTLNSPSGWNNIYNNLATGGAGGGCGGGSSGAPSSDVCKWSGKSGGSNGSTGQAAANYSYDGGNRLFTSKATANAQSVSGSGMTMSGGTLSLNHASPLIQAASQKLNGARFINLELHSVDGSLISTTKSDTNGYYRFNTDFSGLGYIQVIPVASYKAVAKGTTSPDGHESAFDPVTLRSETINFLFGTATNQHVELILNPVEVSLKTNRGTVSLVNMSDGSTLWKTKVLPNCYSGGFTTSTYDVNGDNTADYILIPRQGVAKPIFIDGRTGAPTYIANQVSRGLRAGFVAQPFNLSASPSSNPTTQWVFSPSNNRQGLVSLVDTKVKRSLWTSKQTVFGPTIVTTAISNFQSGSTYGSTPSVILTSVNRFNYKYEKVLDGRNGKVTQIDEKLVGSPLLVQHWKNLINHKVKPVQGVASKMVSIPRKSLPVMN